MLAVVVITLSVLQNMVWVNSMAGAVVTADSDPRKQVPIPGVEVTGSMDGEMVRTRSDATGYFNLIFPKSYRRGEAITLKFSQQAFQPYETLATLTRRLYVARLKPASGVAPSSEPQVVISDVRVRYTIKTTNTIDVGSSAETFEASNVGNVPCPGRGVCSPDGVWKGALGTFSLDAGDGQEFQNVRVSCIAGPCPFTKVEKDNFSQGGRKISGVVRAWSDTTTFLVEADVLKTVVSDMVRQSYPSIFGRTMTFTLPQTGHGPAIEADLAGVQTIYPLGPTPVLSWATCNLQVTDKNRTKVYACALRSGYRFR